MNIKLIITQQGIWHDRSAYVLSQLLDTLGLNYTLISPEQEISPETDLLIIYGTSKDLRSYADKTFNMLFIVSTPKLDQSSQLPERDVYQIAFGDIISYYFFHSDIPFDIKGKVLGTSCDPRGNSRPAAWMIEQQHSVNIILSADLILSAFSLISCMEEYDSPFLDKHGRFDESHSFLIRKSLHTRPLINEYLLIIKQLIMMILLYLRCPSISKSLFPDGRDWGICISHDVDVMNFWQLYSLWLLFTTMKAISIRKALPILLSLFKNFYKIHHAAEILLHICQLESNMGLRSTNFFFAREVPLREALKAGIAYDGNARYMKSIISRLHKGGHEISLHGSYNSYNDEKSLREEKLYLSQALGNEIRGIRQHFLRFKVPDSWSAQYDAGLLYDSSIGFYSTNGFRAGCCFPYVPYDSKGNEKIDILEIPLVLMDRSYAKYQNRDFNHAKLDILELLRVVRINRGFGSILWHSHSHDLFGLEGSERLYLLILRYLSDNRAYSPTMSEFLDWHTRRSATTITYNGHSEASHRWRVSTECDSADIYLDISAQSAADIRVASSARSFQILSRKQNTVIARIPELRKNVAVSIEVY
jgi:hypothetical protein